MQERKVDSEDASEILEKQKPVQSVNLNMFKQRVHLDNDQYTNKLLLKESILAESN